ncbi:hypothetical protein [Roseiconus lacunae]|uniref:hypothetical protein n=1 Tax=Roseiconus lacunae TaxID=2605694 RepID=UPI001E5E467C|nr:hypothetical protein [Roseiconus lacunae]MCD0461151.1 hypothetical protein [Roseiconus lacunae]
MSKQGAIRTVLLIVIVLGISFAVYTAIHTYRSLPEAYAAWDTGTLLVAFMQVNGDQWPTDWDDLVSVRDSSRPMIFSGGYTSRGEFSDNGEVKRQLSKYVSVDWSYESFSGSLANPVTRLDGSKFDVVWVGGEPNEMIRTYVQHVVGTRR